MAIQYKSIGMREQDYQVLREKKEAIERLIKKRLDWADFLLLLADLKPVGEVVGQKIEVAELHEPTGEEGTGSDDEWEDVSWATRQQVEEIMRAEADRIIEALKKS